jgi:hypothetical protein
MRPREAERFVEQRHAGLCLAESPKDARLQAQQLGEGPDLLAPLGL